MIATTSFVKICKLKGNTKVIQGSQGAGKTYSVLSRWIFLALKSNKPQYCSIVTATMPQLRGGAIKDFQTICKKEGVTVSGTKSPFVFQINQWTFEFFSVDVESKGLGARRDRLFINEANRLPWKTARQLIKRSHVERIFDFNPVARFWAHEMFVEPKLCDFIKLTYKDNECLPQVEVEDIEVHSPEGRLPDANFWRVYGLGEIGFVEGQILTFDEYEYLPEGIDYQEAVGVDWGWEDAMTGVKVYVDHKNKRLYWNELYYASHAEENDLFKTIIESPLYNEDPVLCDHSPRSVMAARDFGLAARNAIKPTLTDRIVTVKQYKLFIHKDSINLIREASAWKYQEKKGVIVFYPDQHCDDHAIDAAMYGSTFVIRN